MITIDFLFSGTGETVIEAHVGKFARASVDLVEEKDRFVKMQLAPSVIRFSEVKEELLVQVETVEGPADLMLKIQVKTGESVVSIRVPGHGEVHVTQRSTVIIEYLRRRARVEIVAAE